MRFLEDIWMCLVCGFLQRGPICPNQCMGCVAGLDPDLGAARPLDPSQRCFLAVPTEKPTVEEHDAYFKLYCAALAGPVSALMARAL